MLALVLQSALLLLGAYFLGAFVGCLVRRTFFAPAVVQATQRSGTVLETAPAAIRSARADATVPSPEATRRFEEALSGIGTGSAAPAPRPQPTAEVLIKPAQPTAPAAPADTAEARAPEARLPETRVPDRGPAAPAPAPAVAPSTPSIAAAAAAAAAAGAGATLVTPAAPQPERSAAPRRVRPSVWADLAMPAAAS